MYDCKNHFGGICMKSQTARTLSLTAMLTALTCAATMVIRIPTPTGGYVNLGDTLVLLSAVLLGPGLGMIAAGIGSALSDFLAGYMLWVPATLIIKGLMALVGGWLYRKSKKLLLAGLPAEMIMILGYFLFEAVLVGQGLGAAAGIPGNMIQAVFGLIAATALVKVLQKNSYLRELFPNL